MPRQSEYVRATVGERATWGPVEHLLANIIDVLQLGNWQRARAHFKGKPKPPKPIRRPGDKTSGQLGKAVPITEFRRRLARRRRKTATPTAPQKVR